VIKFTDKDLEPADGHGHSFRDFLSELKTQPGRWAELERYEMRRIRSAASRGSNYKKRYPGVQYSIEIEGDEAVLYVRWVEKNEN
jgi:hypothetical protein